MQPLLKKLVWTWVASPPSHSQSISSRSSDCRVKLVATPTPREAWSLTSTRPKKMYPLLVMVGASILVADAEDGTEVAIVLQECSTVSDLEKAAGASSEVNGRDTGTRRRDREEQSTRLVEQQSSRMIS